MYVVGRVAERFGPSWWAVRDQPYDDTLQAYLSLMELERLEGLEARQQELQRAALTNYAVNGPKSLDREIQAHERRLQRTATEKQSGMSLDELRTFPGFPPLTS